MYFIFYRTFYDVEGYSGTLEEINIFMERYNIKKDDVYLLKGEMISSMDNRHWPKEEEKNKAR